MIDTVGLYLKEIGGYTLLNKDQETELAQAIEKGRNTLVIQEQIKYLGSAAVGEARDFVVQEVKADLSEEEQEKRLKSPYFRLLVDVVDVADHPRRARTDVKKGHEAKRLFINSNLRLVVSIARRYPLPRGMELLDLIQEGNLGLEHAVDKFDWRKGFKFSTYATFWIRQALGRAIDQKGNLIRVPNDRSMRMRQALRQVNGDPDQLPEELREIYILTTLASLNKSMGEDEAGTEFEDFIASKLPGPEEIVLDQADREEVSKLLGILDARTRYVVEARYGLLDGEKRSLAHIGEQLNITGEAVRRLLSRATVKMREEAERMQDA